MVVKTFEFSSVDGRRFVKPTDRWLNLRVDHNSTVTLISELGDRQASVDFRFTANYHASEAVVYLIQPRLCTSQMPLMLRNDFSCSTLNSMLPSMSEPSIWISCSSCIPFSIT